jgi:hypothetical protein
MIYEIWSIRETFQAVMKHVSEFVSNNPIEVHSFSVHPLYDDDTNEIVSYQAVLHYMKVPQPITIEEAAERG